MSRVDVVYLGLELKGEAVGVCPDGELTSQLAQRLIAEAATGYLLGTCCSLGDDLTPRGDEGAVPCVDESLWVGADAVDADDVSEVLHCTGS